MATLANALVTLYQLNQTFQTLIEQPFCCNKRAPENLWKCIEYIGGIWYMVRLPHDATGM